MHERGRCPSKGSLRASVRLQAWIPERWMALNLRADGPDLHRNLSMQGEALEPVDQGQERVAVGLHGLLALGAVSEDENRQPTRARRRRPSSLRSSNRPRIGAGSHVAPACSSKSLIAEPNDPEAPVSATRRPLT